MRRVFYSCVAALIILPACSKSDTPSPAPTAAAAATAPTARFIDDLKIVDLVEGRGPGVVSGDILVVNYVGKLQDGTKFDSTFDRGQPMQFTIGRGDVIEGWDKGIVGMKVGGKRQITIPPDYAYGDAGVPPSIPPKATLVFEVDLLEIRPPQ
jgi:FKBP-type peptidyl-prolyl cis-trans isomerase